MFDLGGRIFNIQFFTSSGTYTPTKGAKSAIVICVGGGGGAREGGGGAATAGGTSSFGSIISCTGGGGSTGAVPAAAGVVTGADIVYTPGGAEQAWVSSILGYGKGGYIIDTSSTGVSYARGAGGPGGAGLKMINAPVSVSVTVGGGGSSSSTGGSVSRSNGRPGCVIVIEMK